MATMNDPMVDGEQRSFEVVRADEPWIRKTRGGGCPWGTTNPSFSHGTRRSGGHFAGPPEDFRGGYRIVGLDPTPCEAAGRQDIHETILLFGIMFLVGAAGFSSLVRAQHYRITRRSLQQMTAFTETIINQIPVGLLTADQNGNSQRTNEAAQIILKRPDGITGKLSDLPCFVPIASKLQTEETVLKQELICVTQDSGSVPLLVNATVIRDGDGAKAGYALLFSDMTNIKQLEGQLRRLIETLKKWLPMAPFEKISTTG